MTNQTQFAHLSPQEKRVLLNELLQKKKQTSYSYPLSYGQQALWFIYQTAPNSHAYNMSWLLDVQGDLKLSALQLALQQLVNRHPALRTTISNQAESPLQTVHPTGEYSWVIHQAATWTKEALADAVRTAHQQPFELTQGPVLRVTLFQHSSQHHLLLLTMHHLLGDLDHFKRRVIHPLSNGANWPSRHFASLAHKLCGFCPMGKRPFNRLHRLSIGRLLANPIGGRDSFPQVAY